MLPASGRLSYHAGRVALLQVINHVIHNSLICDLPNMDAHLWIYESLNFHNFYIISFIPPNYLHLSIIATLLLAHMAS